MLLLCFIVFKEIMCSYCWPGVSVLVCFVWKELLLWVFFKVRHFNDRYVSCISFHPSQLMCFYIIFILFNQFACMTINYIITWIGCLGFFESSFELPEFHIPNFKNVCMEINLLFSIITIFHTIWCKDNFNAN